MIFAVGTHTTQNTAETAALGSCSRHCETNQRQQAH